MGTASCGPLRPGREGRLTARYVGDAGNGAEVFLVGELPWRDLTAPFCSSAQVLMHVRCTVKPSAYTRHGPHRA